MNKDMENTFNQMAELGGSDERLGTNTTPIINAPLLPMNTRPAAPVEGLETVSWRTDDYKDDKSATTYDKIIADRWSGKEWPVEELVTRSQAEAIIAAKDEKIHDMRFELLNQLDQVATLEADNAALTARVKTETKLREDHQERNKELETQLAVARKDAATWEANFKALNAKYAARATLEDRP